MATHLPHPTPLPASAATPSRGAQAYRDTQVLSRTPMELVVMLYDGAIAALGQARDAMAAGDLVTKRHALSRGVGIVQELQNMLNMEAGGEIADCLDGLYTYVTGRCYEANAQRHPGGAGRGHPAADAAAGCLGRTRGTGSPARRLMHTGPEGPSWVTADLETTLADYRTGLDAELSVLARIEALAVRQRDLPEPAPPDVLTELALERQRQLAALTALEQQVAPLRDHIARRLDDARRRPGFEGIAERHRQAADVSSRILRLDQDSLAILERADAERRAAAQALDTGEVTLAAYRRMIPAAPLPARPVHRARLNRGHAEAATSGASARRPMGRSACRK